jgi:Domain of unknown function DUF11
MRYHRFSVFVFCAALALSVAACHDDNSDITAANQSLVRLSIDTPGTAKAGSSFGIQVRALNVGLAGIHNSHVTVTIPAPLTVLSVSAPSGTNATFSNGTSGASVDWDFGTLDSNSESKLDITVMGMLAPTESTKKVTIVAQMTAQGINPGNAVAQSDVTLVL